MKPIKRPRALTRFEPVPEAKRTLLEVLKDVVSFVGGVFFTIRFRLFGFKDSSEVNLGQHLVAVRLEAEKQNRLKLRGKQDT